MIKRLLYHFGYYPNIFLSYMPFKIYEFKEILKEVKFSKNEIILDVGCGNGLQTVLLGKRCKKIIGIDVSEEAITYARRFSLMWMGKRNNCEFRRAKIDDGFADEYFDKIFSICVIQLIPNYIEVLKEAQRILKKGGQMVFSVDSLETIEDGELLEKHKKNYQVEQYFREKNIRKILEEVGFKKIAIYPIFKSSFAKKLFVEGINNGFRFGRWRSIFEYFRLRYEEMLSADKEKGILLIVKCYK